MKKLVKVAIVVGVGALVAKKVVEKLKERKDMNKVQDVEEANEVVNEEVEVKEENNDDEYIVPNDEEVVEGKAVNDNIEGAANANYKAIYNLVVIIGAIIEGHKARKLFDGVDFKEGFNKALNKYGPLAVGLFIADWMYCLFRLA